MGISATPAGEEKPKVAAPEPTGPVAPMGVAGAAAETLATAKPVETTPTPTPTPTENVAPGPSEKVGQETQAGRGVEETGKAEEPSLDDFHSETGDYLHKELSDSKFVVQTEQRPDNVPGGWIVFNAPRPIAGDIEWKGEFRHGVFFAAIDPAGERAKWMVDNNKGLDAWPVVYKSKESIKAEAIKRIKELYPKVDIDTNVERMAVDNYLRELSETTYGKSPFYEMAQFETHHGILRAKEKAWADKNVQLAGETARGVEMQSTKNPDKRVIISLSTYPEYKGKWQISYFDKDGAIGHHNSDSLESAIRDVSGDYDGASMPYGRRGEYKVTKVIGQKPETPPANAPAPTETAPPNAPGAFEEAIPAPVEAKAKKGKLPQAIAPRAAKTPRPKETPLDSEMTTDWAKEIRELGGINVRAADVWNNTTPEERVKLTRLFGRKPKPGNLGGRPPDEMFTMLPPGHGFTDHSDMIRYFLDGRYDRAIKSQRTEEEFNKAYEEHHRQELGLNPEEWDHYTSLPDAEAEAYLNDKIGTATGKHGWSPEDIAADEGAAEGEIAGEAAAGGGTGDAFFDYRAADEPGNEAKFSLKTRTALESRLANLQTDYPDIDREKAFQVIRTFPKATNDQIANMVADPEMFNRVVRGSLSAAEQKEFGGMALPGKQTGLFEGSEQGKPGGGRLFKTGGLPEALAPKGTGERVTKEQVQSAFPGAKVTESQALKGLYDGFQVDLPNGMRIIVRRDEFIMPQAASLEAGYGKTSLSRDEYIAGEYRRMTKGGMISLAKGEGAGTLNHETFHGAMDLVLTDREKAAVLKQYGDEEAAARAYGSWDPKAKPDTIFGKIMDFFRQIYRGLFPDAESVFGKVKGGEVWERKGGLPAAIAPRYRVEEGGKWSMEGGLAGRITGNARAAREEGKAAKTWLMSLFASNRTSREALKTHQVIAGSQAESATEKMRMQNVFNKYVEGMGPIKGEDTQEFLKLYESGQESQITHPLFKAFGEEFRTEERRQMEIMQMLGDAPKELPNYIDHLWKENETSNQIKAQLMAQVTGGRSMRGPDYFKLLRTVVDIPTGIAAGLEPKFDTLPEMVLAGRSARENRMAATKRLTFIKENGYEKVVRDIDGGTYTVEGADGKEQTFKSINEARKWANDNPGSSEPRFEPDVPQGWRVYPGGYGEVWARVQRRAGQMIPERADEYTLPMGAGRENPMAATTGMGYEDVAKVDAWTRVGHRVGPEDVVRQFEDFLSRGMSGNTAFEIYQSSLHAIRHSQMAFSLFHAFFESINSVATHAGEGIFDSLGGLFTGNWKRAATGFMTLAKSPVAPFTDIKHGLNINKTLMKEGMGIPGEATDNKLLKDARILVGGGMRPEAESKLATILSRHFKEAFKLKGDLGLSKRGNELLQGLSSPTMEVVVPFTKQGSTMFKYLAEVKRWERDNPGVAPTKDVLRNIAYECRQTSDFIYGRMAKDNVAMNGMVKSLLTGVLQFPTWQFGTVGAGVRAMAGAKDVVGKVFDMMQSKEIRQLAMKDRMALQYVTGLLFTVGMTGALMNYALTGKKPETMADYFFPKTGELNSNGSEERLQLPSYFKDAIGFSSHPFRTIGAKLASPIHILTDLIHNKDYWGTQIYDPHDWIGQSGIDVLKYMGKTSAPFALQSFEQGAKQTPGRFAMSLFGVRPVSRETANTPAQNVIDEYNQIMRASTTTKESAEKKKLKGDLMKLAKDQDAAGFEDAASQAVSEGKITRQQVKEIVKESQVPPGLTRFTRLPLEWKLRTWDKASDYEKEQWQSYFLKTIMAEKPENLIKNRDAVVAALDDMGPEFADAAEKVRNLEIPEGGSGIDLSGLGIVGEPPQLGGMEAVGAAISNALEQKVGGLGAEKKTGLHLPSLTRREKKNPFKILGL